MVARPRASASPVRSLSGLPRKQSKLFSEVGAPACAADLVFVQLYLLPVDGASVPHGSPPTATVGLFVCGEEVCYLG
jgi:hypothetical protein